MTEGQSVAPDQTAVRVARWRALHVLVDPAPHVLEDEAGFTDVRHVSGATLNERYFAGRADGLRMSTGEDFLVATA